MATCAVCGNDYGKAFTVTMGGRTQTFDSFECAIHALAPHCEHCGCKVVGHGVEHNGAVYCCAAVPSTPASWDSRIARKRRQPCKSEKS
jgi:hypothetical protein